MDIFDQNRLRTASDLKYLNFPFFEAKKHYIISFGLNEKISPNEDEDELRLVDNLVIYVFSSGMDHSNCVLL